MEPESTDQRPEDCKHYRAKAEPLMHGAGGEPGWCALSYLGVPCNMRPNCTYWKAKPGK